MGVSENPKLLDSCLVVITALIAIGLMIVMLASLGVIAFFDWLVVYAAFVSWGIPALFICFFVMGLRTLPSFIRHFGKPKTIDKRAHSKLRWLLSYFILAFIFLGLVWATAIFIEQFVEKAPVQVWSNSATLG